MRKRRGDSPWSRLTVEQRKLMDKWYFDENLSHQAIMERATKEFGVEASKQTLTAYFRHREAVVGGLAQWEEIEVDDPRARRVGAGMSWTDLEARVMQSAAMAAYEMSLSEPDQMRIKEIRSLMKMLNDHERRKIDRKKMEQKAEVQLAQMAFKVCKEEARKQTKEEFAETLLETAVIVHQARRKGAEKRAYDLKQSDEQTATSPGPSCEPKAANEPSHPSPRPMASQARHESVSRETTSASRYVVPVEGRGRVTDATVDAGVQCPNSDFTEFSHPKTEKGPDGPVDANSEKTTRCDVQDVSKASENTFDEDKTSSFGKDWQGLASLGKDKSG